MHAEVLSVLEQEKSEVINLLFDAFQGSASKSFFASYINKVPHKKYIVVKDKGKCVGVLCVLDRNINLKGVSVKVTWMSYMAVDMSYKSFKITSLLKESLFKYSKENSVLTIGIARKALDWYWYPYGFLGASNFSEIHLDCKEVPAGSTGYNVRPLEYSDNLRSQLCELYNTTYLKLSGCVQRDESIWDYYYTEKIEKNSTELRFVLKNSKIVGYFVFEKNRILEIAADKEVIKNFPEIVNDYFVNHYESIDTLIYEVGLSHPIKKWLANYTHKVNQRYVWSGGHIVKLESIAPLLEILLPILNKRLKDCRVGPFKLNISNVEFCYNKDELSFEQISNQEDHINNKDWIKILFGNIDFETIESVNKKDRSLLKLMFDNLNFQVPYLDQM